MPLNMKQQGILTREMIQDQYVLLHTIGDDLSALALERRGLGLFVNYRHHYSWRKRSGYLNHFILNAKGIEARMKIIKRRRGIGSA